MEALKVNNITYIWTQTNLMTDHRLFCLSLFPLNRGGRKFQEPRQRLLQTGKEVLQGRSGLLYKWH